MRLRTRFVLVLAVFVLVLTGLVSILSQRFFRERGQEIEVALVTESMNRCSRFLHWRAREFSREAGGWSAWDDTCEFIEGRKPEYLAANVVPSTYTEARFHFLGFLNATGEVVFAQAWDLTTNTEMPVPNGLMRHLGVPSPLSRHAHPLSAVSGLIVVDGAVWTMASRPILTSNEEGPVRGAVVIGRRWGDDDEEALALCGGGRYSLGPAAPGHLEQPGHDARTITIESPDFFTVLGHGHLFDLFDQPTISLDVEESRWLFTSGLASLLYLDGWILLSGAAVGGFVLLLVDRWILRALQRSLDALRSGVGDVARLGDPKQRLAEGGGNEIQELGRSVNEMLSALERAQRVAVDRQKALIQSQKLAALGTLVAGVAHEINNPNSVIALNTKMLLRTLDRILQGSASSDRPALPDTDPVTQEARTLVVEMRDASERIAAIVRSLKGFSRPAANRMLQGVHLNEVIHDACAMLRHRIVAADCRLDLRLDPDLPTVRGDAQQLTQVLVNLIQNACEASCRPQSRITVHTVHDPVAGLVTLRVEDQGHGIDQDAVERLFEPFYTTRRDEGGTGLGLPISLAIAEAHQGRLTATPRPEGGACFTLELPSEEVSREC